MLSDRDFDGVHNLLGDAPLLADDTQNDAAYPAPGCICSHTQKRVEEYRDALGTVSTILSAAYSFAPANVGDENGDKR
jgi:hypothetical protein